MNNLKITIILSIALTFIFTGCSNNTTLPLDKEAINTFEISKATQITTSTNSVTPSPSESSAAVLQTTLEKKFASIDFFTVAGVYSRNVVQDNKEITEMFSINKTNFVRIASNEFEQEVYAYNYISDNFTYLYYFDGEMVSKTVFNIDTGAILQDIDGYSELLKIDADDLKTYFYDLINAASITIDEIS